MRLNSVADTMSNAYRKTARRLYRRLPPDLSGGGQTMVAWARQYTLSQTS